MTTTNTAMTKTQRRTAKIAKPYTAALFRVYDKASGVCLGYLSPSEDGKAHYQITCDDLGTWHCTCEGNAKWHRKCQHIKAACELCEIRVKQGRPACRAAAVIVEDEPKISNEEMAAIAAAAYEALDETPAEASPVKETRVALIGGYHYEPQYRDGSQWQSFRDEAGEVIWFCDEMNKDLAHKFIAEDSDEHRSSVQAEYKQRIEEHEARIAAEEARRKAASDRRLTSALNGNRGFSLTR